MHPLSKKSTVFGLVVVVVGSLVQLFADPAMLATIASLVGEQVAAKIGSVMALVGGIVAALGRALNDPTPPAAPTSRNGDT
jgi:hypothetical protein